MHPAVGYGRHRAAAAERRPVERRREVGEALEVVHRQEIVDMRQHRADARRARFEPLVAQQRIEPDEPAAGFREAFHLPPEILAGIGLQAVADQQHDGILAKKAPRPVPIEVPQAAADPRATGPIGHGGGDARQRDVDVAMLQVARDVREPRAEQEHVHAVPVVRDRVEKVQQHARIAVHRARDVAQHDKRRRAPLPPSPCER
jgi:hypothetical protein